MRMRMASWRDIVDEVRYWDAVDLLRNLDDELENARRGFANCVFCQRENYPYAEAEEENILLKPEISEKEDRMEIEFPNLSGVRREDIDVEIEDHELSINVRTSENGEKEVFGWFRMSIPEEMDAETCRAEHRNDSLKICLRRRGARPAKRRIALS